VEEAIVNGTPELEIRDWCRGTLAEVFSGESREVLIDAYFACVKRDGKA
jgi:hypothetical protein